MTKRLSPSGSMAALRMLAFGNQRYVKGRPRPEASMPESLGAPVAAVLCPAGCRISPEVLFDAAPGELYVLQGDVAQPSGDLLAGLEWAAARFGIRLAVILGDSSADAELEVQLAPYDMHMVRAVAGPNGRIRFEPVSFESGSAQACRSRKAVESSGGALSVRSRHA